MEESKNRIGRFLLTYIGIMIPFCIATFWIVNRDMRHMETKQVEIVETQVDQLAGDLEQQYVMYSQSAMSLSGLSALQPLNMIEQPKLVHNGIQTLKMSIMNATQEVEDVFIYYGEGKIYAASGVTTLSTYFVGLLGTEKGSDQIGAELLTNSENSVCLLSNFGKPVYLVQHYPITRSPTSRYQISVNYVLRLSELNKSLSHMFAGRTAIVRLFLADGSSVCFEGKSNEPMQIVPYTTENDGDYYKIERSMKTFGMRIEVLYSTSELYADVRQSQLVGIAIIIGGMLLSMLLSLWFSKRKMDSIEQIEAIINGTADIDSLPTLRGDELSRLRVAVSRLVKERAEYRATTVQYRFAFKRQTTKMLLYGILGNSEEEIKPYLKQCGIESMDPYFYVACMTFECDDAQFGELLEAFAGDLMFEYRVENRHVFAFVAGIPEKDYSRKIRQSDLSELKTVMELLGARMVQFFISRTYDSMFQAQYAFREASAVLARHPAYHPAFLYRFWEIDVVQNRPDPAPDAEQMAQLRAALHDRNRTAAAEALTRLAEENEMLESDGGRIFRRVCLLQEMMANAPDDEQRALIFEETENILTGPATAFYSQLNLLVGRLFHETKSSKVSFDRVMDYINRHFGEYDLTLGAVAKRFNMNESYLSKIFRARTGENYLDHITELRMAEVRRQLVETDRPVAEILESVGYLNKTNYSKKIKSFFGMSASEIRRTYRLREYPYEPNAEEPIMPTASRDFEVVQVLRDDESEP